MSQVITLLAELFLIGCLHMIMNMLIDAKEMPFFSKVINAACYAGSLFVVARFVAVNLLPQLGSIFQVVL